MRPRLKQSVSRARAKVENLFSRRGGFFIEYDYAASVDRSPHPYPELEALCAASPFRELLDKAQALAGEMELFGQAPGDPGWTALMFPPLDGAMAYTLARTYCPKRIVEIGSGDSTRYLARAAGAAALTCIDPVPRRAVEHLSVTWLRRVLSAEDVDLCAGLEAGDILFIDSSHIMLPGTDVDIEFNRIFPRLQPGVLVHIHDIFLPFGYPAHWVERNWNEQNALIGWLFGAFDILYPGHYVVRRHPELIDRAFGRFPVLCERKRAGSMWLRKR